MFGEGIQSTSYLDGEVHPAAAYVTYLRVSSLALGALAFPSHTSLLICYPDVVQQSTPSRPPSLLRRCACVLQAHWEWPPTVRRPQDGRSTLCLEDSGVSVDRFTGSSTRPLVNTSVTMSE